MAKDKEQIIDDGGVAVTAIIEMAGKPKDHLEATFKTFIDKIKEITDLGFYVEHADIAPAEQQEENSDMYSVFAEVDVVCDDIRSLITFCFEANPSSVEITEPEKIPLSSAEFTDALNDFVGRLHQVDTIAKQRTQEARLHLQALQTMVQNAIMLTLLNKPKNASAVARQVGVPPDQVQKFLDVLLKDGKIAQNGDIYSITKEAIMPEPQESS